MPLFKNTDNSSLSQMATYWFVIGWFDNQRAQKSEVRQAAKDVVKSKVYPQTYSSWIHDCDSLCTRTDYYIITTYCSTYRNAIVLEIEIT